MKLAELSSLANTRNAELTDLQNELVHLLLNGSGSDDDVASAGKLLRRTMELWDDVDEMTAHVLSIKSRINIPQIGMSISDAEIVAASFSDREAYVEVLIDALHGDRPGMGEGEEPLLDRVCPRCGEDRGVPISVSSAVALLQAIRNRRTTLIDAAVQASWQVETTWYELEDDTHEMSSSSVAEEHVHKGDADQPKILGPVEALGIGEIPGDFLRPAVEQGPLPTPKVSMDYEVVDPKCPFCMTPGREEVEKAWLHGGADTMSIMEYAVNNHAIPPNTNPTFSRTHFDDHFKESDHFRVPGR